MDDYSKMEYSHAIPEPQQQQNLTHTSSRKLCVDFSWRKFKTLITDPSLGDQPVYIVKCHPLKCKITFRSGPQASKAAELINSSDSDSDDGADDNDIIGSGKVHIFKPDCETVINGRPVRVSAARKWLTHYDYPSTAFAKDPKKPTVMTWKSNSKFKCFDFVLLDESGQPVAKYLPYYLGVRKVATIELLGPMADDPAVRDEVVITGMTLFAQMVYRTSSLLAFTGAVVARPGKDYKVTEKQVREEQERNKEADEFLYPADTADAHFDMKRDVVDDYPKAWDKDVSVH